MKTISFLALIAPASAVRIVDPQLQNKGWSPSAARRGNLQECQGDCDRNSHCKGNLVCHQRNAWSAVPGCKGWGNYNTDYCYDPKKLHSRQAMGWNYNSLQNFGLTPNGAILGQCVGDCDVDAHCRGGLKCYKPTGPVPGCSGNTPRGYQFCYDPADAKTDAPTAHPTASPTTSPTKAPTASPTVTPNFTLKAGSKGVEVNEHGCITDGPGAYAANELAQITVNFDGMLDVIHFKTHDEYRMWNNGWTTMTYAQLYGGGNAKAQWWMNKNSAYYVGSYPSYYRNIAVGSGYEQYASGDSGAIAYRSYSKNGWYNDNWYFTDYLEINGQRYHGPDSPDGVRVKAGTKMTWTTDGAHQEAGFIICLDTNPPPVPKPVFQIKNFNGQDGVKLTAQGCFTDGFGFYRSGERSEIKVLQDGVLFARHFSTEKRYDTLTINGHQYSGDDQVNGNSPDGVAVTAGSVIQWKSDFQMIRSGFIICLGSQEDHDCQAKNCAQWTCDEWCKCFDQKSEDNGEYQHFGCVDDNEETCDCPLNA
jgi:hypothetical protein